MKKITILLIVTFLLSNLFICNVKAEEIDLQTWDFPERKPIETIDIEGYGRIDYTYDHNFRISKTGKDNSVEFTYSECGQLIYADNGSESIAFIYDGHTCLGLIYKNQEYKYIYDEVGSVVSITDEQGNMVCKYEYDFPTQNVYILENDVPVLCSNDAFIGNINPIRYRGWYYDKENNCYYLGEGVYYNVSNNEYIMNDVELILPYSYSCSDVSKVLTLYTQCMNSTTFSGQRGQVSKTQWDKGNRWYDALNDTEICARLIYSENTSAGKADDRTAVAYLIANRINAGYSEGNFRGVMTKSQQFSGINPTYKRLSDTNNARAAQDVTSDVWKQCVKLACILTYTSDKSQIASFYPAPVGISNQVQMYGINAIIASSSFTYKNNKIYQNDVELTDVAVAGKKQYITISSASELNAYKGWNLFYNYKK